MCIELNLRKTAILKGTHFVCNPDMSCVRSQNVSCFCLPWPGASGAARRADTVNQALDTHLARLLECALMQSWMVLLWLSHIRIEDKDGICSQSKLWCRHLQHFSHYHSLFAKMVIKYDKNIYQIRRLTNEFGWIAVKFNYTIG